MGLYTLFVILIVIAAILMIGIVLIQESKGGGLASNFSSSNQIMGVRKTTDFIEKATWGLAITMVVCSVICAHVAPTATTDGSVIEKAATSGSTTNPNNLPNFGASQQKQTPATDAKEAAPAKTEAQSPANGNASQEASEPSAN
ncbi:MAG: preprotein translocase subunit SecG [Prevotella sp.]|nr:preprotein translocase subunit SecG [Prevotella sp.]